MRNEQIPLNKLVLSPANVRKTGADVGLDELAASIAAHGLLQNLVVRPGATGKFAVEAGGRRLRALQRLAKRKSIAKDAPIDESPAAKALAERHEGWRLRLPDAAEELWPWLLGQDPALRLDLLAHCAGHAIDAVHRAHDPSSGRLVHADQLAAAVDLDMAGWWQPTADRYLGRVSKARILEAVSEGVSPEAAENLAKLKKEALVAHAEERLAGTGWLPSILRTPAAL